MSCDKSTTLINKTHNDSELEIIKSQLAVDVSYLCYSFYYVQNQIWKHITKKVSKGRTSINKKRNWL